MQRLPQLLALLLTVPLAGILTAQEPTPNPKNLPRKPQWQRTMPFLDRVTATALVARAEFAQARDDYEGVIKAAEELLALHTKLLGEDHSETIEVKCALQTARIVAKLEAKERHGLHRIMEKKGEAERLESQSRQVESLPIRREMLETTRKILGEENSVVADCYTDVAVNLEAQGKGAEASPLFQKALEIDRRIRGEQHPITGNSYNNLAMNLQVRGKTGEADPLFQKALAISLETLGEKHTIVATVYNNLAMNRQDQGKTVEAEPLFRKCLEIQRQVLGEEHRDLATTYNNLALNYQNQGRTAEAGPLLQKALAISRKQGEYTPLTATIYSSLGLNLQDQGKADEAGLFYRKALEIQLRVLGEEHPDTANTYDKLAGTLAEQGKAAEALVLHEKGLEIRLKVFGENHPLSATSYNNLALNLRQQGKAVEAEVLYEKALGILREVRGEQHEDTANSIHNLAMSLQIQGKTTEAETLYRKALKIRLEVLGEKHPRTALTYNNLALVLQHQGKLVEAESLHQKSLKIRLEASHENYPDLAMSYNNLASCLETQGKTGDANALYLKALEISRTVFGEAHRNTAGVYANLASNLREQGKSVEAEAALRKAILGFEASRLTRASGIERAIDERFTPRLALAAMEQAKAPAAAYLTVEAAHARGLLDQQTQTGTKLTANETAERDRLEGRLIDLQSRILPLLGSDKRTEEETRRYEQLLQERREAGGKLAELAVADSVRQVASLEVIQAAMPPSAALLLWVDERLSSDRVQDHFACVVRSTGDPLWLRLPGSGKGSKWTPADDRLAAQLRIALARRVPPSNLDQLIQQLRRQRIEPVLKHLQSHQITQLNVVAVNAMAGLPVEVLAPEFAISYVPSGTFLARLPKKPRYENTLLAVGDPIYQVKKSPRKALTALPPHGLMIRGLAPGGLAAKQGFQPGEVLLQYGETRLTRPDELRTAIQKTAGTGEKRTSILVWRVDEKNAPSEERVPVPVGPLGVIVGPDPAPIALAKRRESESAMASLSRGEELNDLPGTRYEVTRISELFAEPKVFLDGQASERTVEALRQAGELGRFRYLHFATHGKGNSTKAFDSELILSRDQPRDAFAKPGAPWINNAISAREVLEHWKLNADLVTLSACETGLGKWGGGDGLLGFAQAFLNAGSRSVCLSLWGVDDLATALLMQRFYQNLLGKRPGLTQPMTKRLALQEAKAWLRDLTSKEATALTATLMNGIARGSRGEKQFRSPEPATGKDDNFKPYASPHYWSAFVLFGDAD